MTIMNCAICGKPHVKKWVNPTNPNNYDYYCQKHTPAKAFEKFMEIKCYFTNVKRVGE